MTIRRGRSAYLVPENEDEVRMERVHELRQAIAAGSYAVPEAQVAESVMASMVVRAEDEAA